MTLEDIGVEVGECGGGGGLFTKAGDEEEAEVLGAGVCGLRLKANLGLADDDILRLSIAFSNDFSC